MGAAEILAEQALLEKAKRARLLQQDAALPVMERPSWVILAVSFMGAQFAIWPFLGFLAMFVKGFSLLEPPASLVLSLLAISGGVWVLRQRGIGLFVAQLGAPSWGCQGVTQTPHGLNQVAAQFFAQAMHIHLHRIAADVIFPAVEFFFQLGT